MKTVRVTSMVTTRDIDNPLRSLSISEDTSLRGNHIHRFGSLRLNFEPSYPTLLLTKRLTFKELKTMTNRTPFDNKKCSFLNNKSLTSLSSFLSFSIGNSQLTYLLEENRQSQRQKLKESHTTLRLFTTEGRARTDDIDIVQQLYSYTFGLLSVSQLHSNGGKFKNKGKKNSRSVEREVRGYQAFSLWQRKTHL